MIWTQARRSRYCVALHALIVPDSYIGFGSTLLYAVAVSMYTTINFAILAGARFHWQVRAALLAAMGMVIQIAIAILAGLIPVVGGIVIGSGYSRLHARGVISFS